MIYNGNVFIPTNIVILLTLYLAYYYNNTKTLKYLYKILLHKINKTSFTYLYFISSANIHTTLL